ncbi:MAG: TetR/AcrR family transcriptional regulator, partial [Pseudonocardiaceae bacterium]
MTVEGTQRSSSWREYTDQGLSKVLAAALAAFVEKGYDGASIREIASRSGLSVPGLYHHYPSKQALLVGLTNVVMRD